MPTATQSTRIATDLLIIWKIVMAMVPAIRARPIGRTAAILGPKSGSPSRRAIPTFRKTGSIVSSEKSYMTMNFLNSKGYWNRSRTVCVSGNASVQASELKLSPTSFPGSVSRVFRWITLAFTLLSSLQGLAYNCNVTVINGGTTDYWQTGTILTIYGRICVSPYAWTSQPFSLPPGNAHTFLGVELCGSPDFLRIQYSDGSNWVVTPSKAAVNGG